MNTNDWFTLFLQQLRETPLIQWIGVSFGITEVFLAKANKVWLYPAGLISISISIITLFQAGLFAESALNIYYFAMSIYGWIMWKSRNESGLLKTSYASARDWKIALSIVGISFIILYLTLTAFTTSTVPMWDSWVSATAWAGMWLLAKRKIENWIFLNVSNAFAIPLLVHKELPLYAILTTLLFFVAIQGYLSWKRTIQQTTLNLTSN